MQWLNAHNNIESTITTLHEKKLKETAKNEEKRRMIEIVGYC